MRIGFIICLLLVTNTVFGQKNIIKARAIYLPFQTQIYSFGIGYEHVFYSNLALQLLYNSKGGTFGFDAPTTYVKGFVPEVRYYFGKKEDIRKKAFVAGFVEIYKQKEYPGMPVYSGDYLSETNGNLTSMGVLIGRNASIGKHFLVDMYIGYRYKIFDGAKTFRDRNNGEYYDVEFKEQESGVRLGLNLGYLF